MKKIRLRQINDWFFGEYDKECFQTYREEIDSYNIRMLGFFNALTLALLAIVFISGFFTGYVAAMQPVYIITAVLTILEVVLDRLVLFKKKVLDGAVFLCMTKIYLFCIVSGVYYSKELPAISLYAFMVVLSILFITRPWKLNLYNFFVGLVFCVCSFSVKDISMASGDIFTCWAFYVVASTVSFWIVKLRVEFIRNEKLLIIQRDTDMLTTLPNRRRFNIYAEEAFHLAKDGSVSFLMMDIDHFKAYNDTKGHIAGDYCLEKIGRALGRFGEEHGMFFARYGGEEFVAIDMHRSTRELEETAQEIVQMVYQLGLPHESSSFKRITISVGFAAQAEVGAEDYIQLLQCADKALYEAKQHGRNKVAEYKKESRKDF